MAEVPAGAKKPADRKSKIVEEFDALAQEEALLSDLPPLKPVSEYRPRDRARITATAMQVERFTKAGVIDTDDPNQIAEIYNVLADFDELAESLALDPEAYVAWSQRHSAHLDVLFALLTRLSRAVGEVTASSD